MEIRKIGLMLISFLIRKRLSFERGCSKKNILFGNNILKED